MKKLFLILSLVISCNVFSQNYRWDFAITTGICPLGPRIYPFEYNDMGLLSPMAIEYDYEGNIYVMGLFRPTVPYEKEYQITPNIKISASPNCQTEALYIYKLNNKGELIWANAISHDIEPFGSEVARTELVVNPFSGKFYIVNFALDHFYINQNKFTNNFDNSKGQIKRMMLCFNADGTHNKVLSSVYVLEKPVFSSASEGVYKASKIEEFYPWNDSVSFYSFNALNDSITKITFANYDNILFFDSKTNVYVTNNLAEYNTQLVKTRNSRYNHTHNYYGGKLLNYGTDKLGNHYFHYNNTNVGTNYEYKFVLFKLDSNFKEIWRHTSAESFQIDTSGNAWLLVPRSTELNSDSVLQNPSDVFLVKLNANDGKRSNTRIVPTNLIQQTSASGLFKINKQNDFFIAGFLYNEAEFGNYKLSMQCNGDFIPLQHFVAKAKEGWEQDRKNLSVNNLENAFGLKIYPNPTNGNLTFENPLQVQLQSIELFDLMGRKQHLNVDGNNNNLNFEDSKSGIYFLKITAKQKTHTLKIIKQ